LTERQERAGLAGVQGPPEKVCPPRIISLFEVLLDDGPQIERLDTFDLT